MVRASVFTLTGIPHPIQPVDGMVGVGVKDVGLNVAVRTHLEMDPVFQQVFHQRRVFETGHSVAQAWGRECLHGLPNVTRTPRLSGVGRVRDPILARVTEGRDVGGDGVVRIVSRDVEGCHVRALELRDQAHEFHASFCRVEG
jgi:hypothetical protein